jgi:hypothetical protein
MEDGFRVFRHERWQAWRRKEHVPIAETGELAR